MTPATAAVISRSTLGRRLAFVLAAAAIGTMVALVVVPSAVDAMDAVLPLRGVESSSIPAAQSSHDARSSADGLKPSGHAQLEDLGRVVAVAAVKPDTVGSVFMVAAAFIVLLIL